MVGRPVDFVIAIGLVLVWAIFGHSHRLFGRWQLVLNISTTIVTFLMGSSCRTRRTAIDALFEQSLTR